MSVKHISKEKSPSDHGDVSRYEDLFGEDSIRNALKSLNDQQRLQRHPLARLNLIGTRCRDDSDASERGAVLRDVLREAIESLKPEGQEPDYMNDSWRPYLILTKQYVSGRSPDYLADRMSMGRTTYYRKQSQTMHLLGNVLRKMESSFVDDEVAAAAPRPPFMAPPRPTYGLVGRDAMLRDLKRRLMGGESISLSALHGLPGVGKTALAVELANDPKVLAHFEDGVLWAGLGRQPDVLALLSAWGAALGIPADDLAQMGGVEERARAVHTSVGTRRMLLVVDDAWEAEAALAFKVGGPNCAHMLTTRIPQVALAFADGGVASVSELGEDDGLALLARMAPGAVEAEPDEVQALVRAVGGLPLALTLMGWHLRKESYGRHPRRLREALERLCEADARQQITQPQTVLERRPDLPAETPLSLQAVIDISVEALDEEEQEALRALSVLPPKPNTFSEEAALAVAGVPVEVLDALVDHGLLEPSGAWRYTMHQTIADYARLRLADDAGAQRAARERMVSYYVDYVKANAKAYSTLEVESDNVVAALATAFEEGMEAALVQGANAFYLFLEARGLCDLAKMHLDRARQMAHDKGDVTGLVSTLRNLGQAMQWLGNYEQADAFYQEGLNLARESGDSKSATAILQGLGIVAACRGDYAQTEAFCQEGLSLARESGDWEAEGALLSSLGDLCLALGRAEQATGYFQRALVISREAGNRETESMNLIYLGLCSHSLGDVKRAIERYQQALSLAREIGDRRAEGYALGYLGYAHVTWGQIEAGADDHYLEAVAYYRQALTITREIGHRKGEAECLITLGVAYCALGQTEQAIEVTESALAIARELGVRSEESRGLCGLGDAYRGLGKIDRAIECYQQALAIAREIGGRRQEADALSGLAEAYAALEQVQPAIECAEQALAIREEIKSPKAAQMQELLAQLRAQVASPTTRIEPSSD